MVIAFIGGETACAGFGTHVIRLTEAVITIVDAIQIKALLFAEIFHALIVDAAGAGFAGASPASEKQQHVGNVHRSTAIDVQTGILAAP